MPQVRALRSTPGFERFLAEIRLCPLLTQDEEKALAQRIEAGHAAQSELQGPNVSVERRPELRDVLARAREAVHRYVESNMLLVTKIAYHANVPGTIEDKVQNGVIGLKRAVEKFEWRRGWKFSTYATPWIYQAITRGAAAEIRIPTALTQQHASLTQAIEELQSRGEPLTDAGLAEASGLSSGQVRQLRKLPAVSASLHARLSEGAGELGDHVVDPEAHPDPVWHEVITPEIVDAVRAAIARLSEPQREVVRLRWGIGAGGRHTRRHVAAMLELSQNDVARIEQQALRRLSQLDELRSLAG